jgi:hypothetical protein
LLFSVLYSEQHQLLLNEVQMLFSIKEAYEVIEIKQEILSKDFYFSFFQNKTAFWYNLLNMRVIWLIFVAIYCCELTMSQTLMKSFLHNWYLVSQDLVLLNQCFQFCCCFRRKYNHF